MSIEFEPLEWVDTDDPEGPATPSDPKLNAATLNAREAKLAELVGQINALLDDAGQTELDLAAKADLTGPGGTVPDAQIRAATTSVRGLSRILGGTADAPTVPASALTGTIAQAQIPSIALTEHLGAVASQAAMLALSGQRGDWCTRTDLGTDWQLIAEPSSTLGSWRQMTYPASPVSSVNGRTGGVTGLAEQTALDAAVAAVPEQARDALAAALVAGSNVTITPNDGADTITIAATGGGSYTDEQARDAIAAALTAGTNVTVTVNDGADTITISSTGTQVTVDGDPVTSYDVDTTPITPALIGAAPATPGRKPPAGNYFVPVCQGLSDAASDLGNGNIRAVPWVVEDSFTIDRIGATITSAGVAGSKLRLGIYSDTGSYYPGNLLVDAGQIAGDSATAQELTISVALTPGVYWLAAAVQSAATSPPSVRTVAYWSPRFPLRAGTSLSGFGGYIVGYGASASGAFPSTFPAFPASAFLSGAAAKFILRAA